jgi:hypothetical protein
MFLWETSFSVLTDFPPIELPKISRRIFPVAFDK